MQQNEMEWDIVVWVSITQSSGIQRKATVNLEFSLKEYAIWLISEVHRA